MIEHRKTAVSSRSIFTSPRLIPTFLRFAVAGALGFVADASVLLIGQNVGLNPIVARVPSVSASIVLTFALNNLFTFGGSCNPGGILTKFYKYLTASLGGLTLNWAVYVMLILYASTHPLVALVIATLTTMLFNFTLYRYFVFQGKR